MEARGTKIIFMPPFRCRMLSRAWRSSAALRPPLASASLKRDAMTATITATWIACSSCFRAEQPGLPVRDTAKPLYPVILGGLPSLGHCSYLHLCRACVRTEYAHDPERSTLASARVAHLNLRHAGAGAGSAPGQECGAEAVSAGAVLGSTGRIRARPALGPHALRLRPVPRCCVQGVQGHLPACNISSSVAATFSWHATTFSVVRMSPLHPYRYQSRGRLTAAPQEGMEQGPQGEQAARLT